MPYSVVDYSVLDLWKSGGKIHPWPSNCLLFNGWSKEDTDYLCRIVSSGDLPGVPVVKNLPSNAENACSISR